MNTHGTKSKEKSIGWDGDGCKRESGRNERVGNEGIVEMRVEW